jgi:hypothetical protein
VRYPFCPIVISRAPSASTQDIGGETFSLRVHIRPRAPFLIVFHLMCLCVVKKCNAPLRNCCSFVIKARKTSIKHFHPHSAIHTNTVVAIKKVMRASEGWMTRHAILQTFYIAHPPSLNHAQNLHNVISGDSTLFA